MSGSTGASTDAPLPPAVLPRVLAPPRAGTWQVAEEVAVEVGFCGVAWTVTMASPTDPVDLAIGLALSERLLASAAEVRGAAVRVLPEGITVDLQVDDPAAVRVRAGRRVLEGVTGCGLCGVETLADTLLRDHPPIRPVAVTRAAVAAALAALPEHQVLNARCHTLHAAAWCAADGTVRWVREDLGRHNALDKVLGARAQAGVAAPGRLRGSHGSYEPPEADEPGFIVVSSRCSYELVRKCAAHGIGVLASVSAPTGQALRFAEAVGIRLLARDAADGSVVEFVAQAGAAPAGRAPGRRRAAPVARDGGSRRDG